ncbi:DUF4376 domain-containing protein [Aeromonas caviae]|uniref:DUF4376 domain-containing protein n=1 Tax=Aeromonas caviae TaxID=648 RepID=UPI0038CF9E0F
MSIDWSQAITSERRAAEQALADYEAWKVERQERVDALVVEVDGLVFDGNEISTRRMADVIAAADDLVDTTEWTLADNKVVVVSVRQLKQALRLSTATRTAIWNDGRPA